ncbi:hypothetical protein N8677_02600, partial [Verrucomicrobia bacterium]|nr:hypothetical protein [Verrucomicrobiota bacterium]
MNNKKRLDSPDLIHLRIDRHEVPNRTSIYAQKSPKIVKNCGVPYSNSCALATHHLQLKNNFSSFAPFRDSLHIIH